MFPDHEVVDRTSINAWLTPNFVKAVEATRRKRMVIAGLWTGACAAFNVIELEHAEAIVAGAEAAGRPVVLQISENTADYHGALAPLAEACLPTRALHITLVICRRISVLGPPNR